jgi:CDP-4-dehydro-6-deoxyglucose reductase, E1
LTIPLMRSTCYRERETITELAKWLLTFPDKLSMSTYCARFEKVFAYWQGRKHAVLFNSGASANLAILQALINLARLPKGVTVGFSALTWATNVMPLMQLGFDTLPIDIDPCTLNVMSTNLRPVIEQLDALFITNALGFLPDLDSIRNLCEAFNVTLIEDNCESLGSALPSGNAGNFGVAASFSFFVAHHMSTIEGGMAVTDDEEFADMLRMVRANGWDRNLPRARQEQWRKRYAIDNEFDAAYTFYVLAYNLRPTEITGFLGLQQLKHVDEAIRIRGEYFAELETTLKSNDDFMPLQHDHMTTLSPFAFPVLCKTTELREMYKIRFQRAGVEIRPIIAGNIARQPFYRHLNGHHHLPGADFVEQRGFYFGLYPELTRDDMETLKTCLS